MNTSESKRILVVDDEEDVLRFLSLVLVDAGFQVVTAANSDEARERLKEQIPDLISLDIVMPKASGIKLFRELQKNSEWSNIPVMIVTGHARDELGKADFNEMTLSGPGVYLEKPVTPERYLAAVQKILGADIHAGDEQEQALKEKISFRLDAASPEVLKEILNLMNKKK